MSVARGPQSAGQREHSDAGVVEDGRKDGERLGGDHGASMPGGGTFANGLQFKV